MADLWIARKAFYFNLHNWKICAEWMFPRTTIISSAKQFVLINKGETAPHICSSLPQLGSNVAEGGVFKLCWGTGNNVPDYLFVFRFMLLCSWSKGSRLFNHPTFLPCSKVGCDCSSTVWLCSCPALERWPFLMFPLPMFSKSFCVQRYKF